MDRLCLFRRNRDILVKSHWILGQRNYWLCWYVYCEYWLDLREINIHPLDFSSPIPNLIYEL